MIPARERVLRLDRDILRSGERCAAEWEVVVAAHRGDDWPPPEWMSLADERLAPREAEGGALRLAG